MSKRLIVGAVALSAMVGFTPTRAAGVPPAVAIGVKHIMPLLPRDPAASSSTAAPAPNNLLYHGGPIQKVPKVYIVYWGWGGSDPAGERPYLERFFNGVGGSQWANIQTQYTDTERGAITNPAGQLAGVWADDSFPSGGGLPTLPDVYIGNEALRASSHFGYDRDANYIIALPTLHDNAQFFTTYCAFHSTARDASGRTVAFTDLPYIPDEDTYGVGSCGANSVNPGPAGKLDAVSIVAGHEYAEAVTDPHIDAWYDSSGAENGDKCQPASGGTPRNILLSTGTFAVQTLWSNVASACVIR